MEVKREKLLSHNFEPGGKVESHHKDLGIALEAARECEVSLPVTARVNEMFGAMKAKGRGGVGSLRPAYANRRLGTA